MAEIINKENLENILKKGSDGKPILELTPLGKTAVHTKTQEEYNELMKVYELGNWRKKNGNLPTMCDIWFLRKEKSCITAGNIVSFKNIDYDSCSKNYYLHRGYKIISKQKFYKIQKITPEILKEINTYFGK